MEQRSNQMNDHQVLHCVSQVTEDACGSWFLVDNLVKAENVSKEY